MSDSAQYWAGSNWLKTNEVRPLKANSFKHLVETYFNTPVTLKITKSEFLDLPKDERDKMKAGPYITAVSFKGDEQGLSKRNDGNADKLVLACFDLDEGQFVKDFAEAPATISEALHPFNFIAYHTANSAPDAPRLRIIVDIKPCALKHHRSFIAHIVDRLGIPDAWKGERESKVLSQPMAKPVQFLEEPECAAILASRVDGEAMDWRELPEETVEETERIYAYKSDVDLEFDLAFLPIMDLKVQDIREALEAIDASCNYKIWCEVACALKHQFRSEEEAQEAYELFNEWSSGGGSKYKGETATWKKWQSFKPESPGKNPITVRSIFKHAMDAGWENTKIATKLKANIVKWLAQCKDIDELMEEGCKRIAEMPFKNEIVEESLIISLQTRIKDIGKKKIDKATIKKQVNRLRHQRKAEEDDGNTPAWLRPWTFIMPLDLFYSTLTGDLLKPEAFNRTYGIQMMPKDDDDEQVRNGRPIVMPADFALNVKNIRRVSGIVYDPRHGGEEGYFEIRGKEYVNEYRPSTVPREDPKNAKRAGEIMEIHRTTLIKEKEYSDIILHWMAFNVQFPGRKIRWCPVIQSTEGAGKTILLNLMAAALGDENVKRISPVAMSDPKYNDWLVGAQVIGLEEIKINGGNRADVMNKLKEAQTNDKITVHAKYRPVVNVDNIANMIGFTNFFDALYLTPGDRRYCFIEGALQDKDQVDELRRNGHFNDVVRLFKKFPGAVRSYLLGVKIPDSFNPDGEAPDTIYRQGVIEGCKNRLLVAIEEAIAGKDPRIGRDIIDFSVLSHEVSAQSRDNYKPEHFLKELGYNVVEMGRKFPVNGHETSIWIHRTEFDDFFGTPREVLEARCRKYNKEIEKDF